MQIKRLLCSICHSHQMLYDSSGYLVCWQCIREAQLGFAKLMGEAWITYYAMPRPEHLIHHLATDNFISVSSNRATHIADPTNASESKHFQHTTPRGEHIEPAGMDAP